MAIVTQGRYWRVGMSRKRDGVRLWLEHLPSDLEDLASFEADVPFARWNAVVKHAESDRRLLGGILLDLAATKEQVARVIASDRLLADLQRTVRDATVALLEAEVLVVAPPSSEKED